MGRAGADIARIAAPMFKKLSLELGGKNPNLIFASPAIGYPVPRNLLLVQPPSLVPAVTLCAVDGAAPALECARVRR